MPDPQAVPAPAPAPAAPPPAAPPAAPEAPVARDTTTIATQALESLERDNTPAPEEPGVMGAGLESGAPSPQAAIPQTPAEAQVSAALAFLRAQGHEVLKKDGRPNWLPVPTVEKMLGRFLDQQRVGWDGEKKTWETERQAHQRAQAEIQYWRRLVDTDPQALLQRLGELDPRYAALLKREAQQPAEEPDPEPEPDLDLGGGRWTYSTQGIQKVRAWERRQMERTLNERLAPLLGRAQVEQQQQRRAQVETMLRERTAATLAKARTWPRFAEHEAAILKVLQDDTVASEAAGTAPQKTIHDAYMEVVPQTFQSSEQQMRERLLKELQGAPRSTAVTGNGAEPVRKPGPITTEEIARRAMAKLEGRAT